MRTVTRPDVDLLEVLPAELAEDRALGNSVGVLEPSKKLPKGREDLLAQGVRDGVLVLAARLEQPGEALLGLEREQPPLVEEHVERAQKRAPIHGEHLGDAEVDPAGALALRGVHEPEDRRW